MALNQTQTDAIIACQAKLTTAQANLAEMLDTQDFYTVKVAFCSLMSAARTDIAGTD